MATNSYFGQLFIDLSKHIKDKVPAIKWIDQDFGQLEQFEYRPAVSFPCVLIDFPMANYTNIAELSQMGDITVQLRLGFAPFSKSHVGAPDDVRDKAIEYYAIEQLVHEAVQGFQTDYTMPLMRFNAGTEQRLSASDQADSIGLRVRVINYATQYEDNSNLPAYIKRAATLEVETEINIPE